MIISKEDANTILGWANIADGESMCYDKTNVLGRIKLSFPSLAKGWEVCTFFQDETIAKSVAFYKDHPI